MQDRELLEMAAKASGIKVEHDGKFAFPYGLWNPLNDDGDALRLAIDLGIEIDSDPFNKDVIVLFSLSPLSERKSWVEPHMDNPYASTRRAIVRAAAEIGKAMK